MSKNTKLLAKVRDGKLTDVIDLVEWARRFNAAHKLAPAKVQVRK